MLTVAGWCEPPAGSGRTTVRRSSTAAHLLGNYRKTTCWDREKLVFAAGDRLPPVLQHPARGRIAPMICYDLEFPEYPLPARPGWWGSSWWSCPANWPA